MLKPAIITQRTDPRIPDTGTIFICGNAAAWTMHYKGEMYGDHITFSDMEPGKELTLESMAELAAHAADMLIAQMNDSLKALVEKDAGVPNGPEPIVKVLKGFVRVWKGDKVKDINFDELFADRPKVTEVAYFEPMRFAPPDVMEMFEKNSKFIFEPAGGPGGKDKAIFGIRLQSTDLK